METINLQTDSGLTSCLTSMCLSKVMRFIILSHFAVWFVFIVQIKFCIKIVGLIYNVWDFQCKYKCVYKIYIYIL